MMQCSQLTKQRGDFQLKDINFRLEPGYILGVIGVNGVGKTTLLRCLLGSYHPEGESSITLLGKDAVPEHIKPYCRYAELKEIMYYVEKRERSGK